VARAAVLAKPRLRPPLLAKAVFAMLEAVAVTVEPASAVRVGTPRASRREFKRPPACARSLLNFALRGAHQAASTQAPLAWSSTAKILSHLVRWDGNFSRPTFFEAGGTDFPRPTFLDHGGTDFPDFMTICLRI
jgi:hypothetical protein